MASDHDLTKLFQCHVKFYHDQFTNVYEKKLKEIFGV